MSVALDTAPAPVLDVRTLDARLRRAEPQDILQAAVDLYGDRLALVSSFGTESAVLLHMASRIRPDIPVLFLDTLRRVGPQPFKEAVYAQAH